MNPRAAQLLEGLVQVYIDTARPVGSVILGEWLRAPYSPATIRALLHELEEEGYVYQPHTSAGRVPTDQGYRFYVDQVAGGVEQRREYQSLARQLAVLQAEYHTLAQAVARLLASSAHTVAVSGLRESGVMHDAGWDEVLQQPEAHTLSALQEISVMLADLNLSLSELPRVPEEAAVTYIGHENPLFPAKYTSLVVRQVHTPHDTLVMVLLGPKRMPYQQHVALLNTLAEVVRQEEGI